MGITGLARWTNAPTTGLDLVKQNIIRNHGGIERGRCFPPQSERILAALTMNNRVFVLLDDPSAPLRAEHLQREAEAKDNPNPPAPSQMEEEEQKKKKINHFRSTFVTLEPPGALEQLLVQLNARWVPTRQTSNMTRNQLANAGQQLVIDGLVFSIGTDCIIRAGNVILAGGAVKGMLLEAEYLPVPNMPRPDGDGTPPELLQNLLVAVLPNLPDTAIVAVTIHDHQWDELLWNSKWYEGEVDKKLGVSGTSTPADEILTYEDEPDTPAQQKGDWTGIERERRSAFMVIGALRSEGIV